MTIRSLRVQIRPDTLTTQVRVGQSLARRLYLAAIICGITWIFWLVAGPLFIMDADGLVVKKRAVVGAAFPATILQIDVHPGDTVRAGQRIGRVLSTQMLGTISDLTSREMQARSRLAQIDARLAAIESTLPIAQKNTIDANAAAHIIEAAKAHGFATRTREAEITNGRYAAEKESSSLRAEDEALRSERRGLGPSLSRIEDALKQATESYQRGEIFANRDGTIGSSIESLGAALTPGAVIADIYYGPSSVTAYLPTNRLYSLANGDRIVVTDGRTRATGTVTRVEGIADRLPAEFQSGFRAVERRQTVTIALGRGASFPLLTKVRISKPTAPWNLFASLSRW